MKTCAITMVYRDHWALSQWYRHYGRLVGAENLFIVAHGADPEISAICPGASVITIPRDGFERFDGTRGKLLNNLQASLGAVYDWVIRTDVDELICLDPGRWPSLSQMLSAQQAPALFALGLELVELDGDAPLPDGDSVFAHRRNAMFSGHYSKAFAASESIPFVRHGVKLRPRRMSRFDFVMPRGVYLVHLKYANGDALMASNEHRKQIAWSGGVGLPGRAWRKPEIVGADFVAYVQAAEPVPWERAEQDAWDALQTPLRGKEEGILRAQSLKFDQRTQLPGWFAES